MNRDWDFAMDGCDLARELTARADRNITELFDGSFLKDRGNWCIAALGGYGRKELCPFSDLDLLFLMEKNTSQPEIENALIEMLYPLWDAGFDAGYSVRTLKQALHDAGTDFFFLTSLLDARRVCGSEDLYRKFTSLLASGRLGKKPGQFISDLSFHTRKRHEKYGDASYFLEPNIKDGHGGLRDFQSILWAMKMLGSPLPAAANRESSRACNNFNADAPSGYLCGRVAEDKETRACSPGSGLRKGARALLKGFMPSRRIRSGPASLISASDFDEIRDAAGFMLKSRFILHAITGRKTDRMHLEHQEALAEKMGYLPTPAESAVEGFLRDFHTLAVTVRSVFDSVLLYLAQPTGIRSYLTRGDKDGDFIISSGLLAFACPEELKSRPLMVMSAFQKMADEGLSLTPEARSRIKSSAKADTSLKENPAGCSLLVKMLGSPGARGALTSMLETGVMELLIPEFSTIRGKAIFDVYHTYTVDLHSIHTVSELRKLEGSEQEIFALVADRDVLYFSTFLHDIGKGYGRPHAATGAEIIKPIAHRSGFDNAQSELAAFLLKNHLVMSDLASRRDLSEEKVIGDFARKAATPQRLSMLYLLSVADSRATGPNAWSGWKAALLRELYIRTLNFLEKGIFKDPENAMRLEEKWHRLILRAPDRAGVSGRLWALPQSYILSSDVSDIEHHLITSSRITGRDDIRAEVSQRENHTLITFITRDRPKLFSLLTGLLAVNRLEIVSARIFTWYDGTVVDTFKVNAPWQDYRGWHTIEQQCKDIFSGKTDIEARLRQTSSLRTCGPHPVQPRIDGSPAIDNDTSDFFSIIDVRAPVRIGLIHDVSLAIGDMGLNIHRALLTRNSDLITCVFYAVDETGEKLTEKNRLQAVLQKIREVIKPPLNPCFTRE